ncbi:MAG: ribonuclease J [Neomegalonema sp.]|nr:ribonuclease J [Neomegalonema sp.]
MAGKDELVYVALGGAGEIGMNCYLYGFGAPRKHEWLMVDCGVSFGDMSSAPGVDIVMPDIDFIVERRANLGGIVITHAHEDHVGAIARLWRRLKKPVYCTAFTAAIARRKFEEEGLSADKITEISVRAPFDVGPFTVEFLPITHSVPEATSVSIRSPLGTVLHSGDFKIDAEPGLGAGFDPEPFQALGDEGVLCLACDSTNVFEPGVAGSEAELVDGLKKVISKASGAVAASTFASNVARLRTMALAAVECERSVVVAGRAMRRMLDAAMTLGVLRDFPETIGEEAAKDLPAEHLFYLVTGSQGEGRAALARIASGSHPTIALGEGDTVIFSSRTIPGNERDVYKLYNRLSERGIKVVDADREKIHVSGHACRDELKEFYRLLRPQISLPLHGEHRHLVEHREMSAEWGAKKSLLAPNGAMVRLAGPGEIGQIEEVETGRVYLDGSTFVGALDGVMRARLRLARQGHVSIALVVDEEGELIADPEVRCVGAPADGDNWPAALDEMIMDEVDEAVERLKPSEKRSDGAIEEVALGACRRTCDRFWGKKPEVSVIVIRLEEDDDEE